MCCIRFQITREPNNYSRERATVKTSSIVGRRDDSSKRPDKKQPQSKILKNKTTFSNDDIDVSEDETYKVTGEEEEKTSKHRGVNVMFMACIYAVKI